MAPKITSTPDVKQRAFAAAGAWVEKYVPVGFDQQIRERVRVMVDGFTKHVEFTPGFGLAKPASEWREEIVDEAVDRTFSRLRFVKNDLVSEAVLLLTGRLESGSLEVEAELAAFENLQPGGLRDDLDQGAISFVQAVGKAYVEFSRSIESDVTAFVKARADYVADLSEAQQAAAERALKREKNWAWAGDGPFSEAILPALSADRCAVIRALDVPKLVEQLKLVFQGEHVHCVLRSPLPASAACSDFELYRVACGKVFAGIRDKLGREGDPLLLFVRSREDAPRERRVAAILAAVSACEWVLGEVTLAFGGLPFGFVPRYEDACPAVSRSLGVVDTASKLAMLSTVFSQICVQFANVGAQAALGVPAPGAWDRDHRSVDLTREWVRRVVTACVSSDASEALNTFKGEFSRISGLPDSRATAVIQADSAKKAEEAQSALVAAGRKASSEAGRVRGRGGEVLKDKLKSAITTGVCSVCKEKGHKMAACPKVKCHRCGQLGHMKGSCPKANPGAAAVGTAQ